MADTTSSVSCGSSHEMIIKTDSNIMVKIDDSGDFMGVKFFLFN